MLQLHKLDPDQHFTQPPPRFTEASLIKELEERGIGRPSTYVPIVSTIQDRGYVEQQDRRFVPTWLGETVNELMVKHFTDIVDINFTADMERKLDAVEEGKQDWTAFLKDFYTALREQLGKAETEMERVQKPVEEANEACPECGKPLLIRNGRFGRFISCSGFPDCTFKKPFLIKTGALCPECRRRPRRAQGAQVARKIFYGCANFPTCNFAVWDRPLTTPCPECGGLLTLGAGKPKPPASSAARRCAARRRGSPKSSVTSPSKPAAPPPAMRVPVVAQPVALPRRRIAREDDAPCGCWSLDRPPHDHSQDHGQDHERRAGGNDDPQTRDPHDSAQVHHHTQDDHDRQEDDRHDDPAAAQHSSRERLEEA